MTNDISPELTKGDIKKSINASIWIGALLILLGIGAIALPRFSTIVAETWIALILVSAGAAKIVYAFQNRSAESGFIWKLLLSILYIATGVMLFVYPLTGVLTLTILLGSFLLTEGVFELILAFKLRPQQNWTWALGNGIITLILGAMIWFQWPFNAPWLIGTLVGVSVLFTGISRIMLSLNIRSALNQSEPTATI
ncbi:MAG: HdeD family acid-resistance protein [Coleofasciculaceae cyanobacterium]